MEWYEIKVIYIVTFQRSRGRSIIQLSFWACQDAATLSSMLINYYKCIFFIDLFNVYMYIIVFISKAQTRRYVHECDEYNL